MFLPYYKAMYRRIARLPLDQRSLEIARQKLRNHFNTSKRVPTFSVVNRKLYDRAAQVFDSFLVDEKVKDFPDILDLIYKGLETTPLWVEDFHNTRYGAFKHTWPQVHLIDEFGDAKLREKYHQALAELQPKSDFLFSRAMNIPDHVDLGPLTPLPRVSNIAESREKLLLGKLSEFHQFLKANAKKLLETQIHVLDVAYKTNRFGLPPSIATMEAELRKKVNYAKRLLQTFRPVKEEDLMSMIEMVTAKDGTPKINPSFFRYMLRKRAKEGNMVSPDVRKFVRHKLLISNERNILYHYRQYLVRQFYIDGNGKYAMTPMINLYD